MVNTQSAEDKKAALAKQIEGLQKQIADLDQDVLHDLKLKLSDARKVVKDLEAEFAELTGKPANKGKAQRARQTSITDEALQPQLLKVMADLGKEGMNAKQLAEKLQQDPQRIRKFINANPKLLKRQGRGRAPNSFCHSAFMI